MTLSPLVFLGPLWLLMAALLAWQLWAGVALGRDWRPWLRRDERPVAYWATMGFGGAVLAAATAMAVAALR